MYGLKMKSYYLNEIITGVKCDDARLEDTSIRGKIALIDSETYEILGYANLIDTVKIDYESFIKWHICPEYDSLKAQMYIDNLDFTKLHADSYLYKFIDVSRCEVPAIVNPINETKTWIEFNEDDNINGYKQVSLFDF